MLTYGLTLSLQSTSSNPAMQSVQSIIRDWHQQKHIQRQVGSRRWYDESERTYTSGEATVWEYSLSQDGDEGGLWITEVRAFEAVAESNNLLVTVSMRLKSEGDDLQGTRIYVETPSFIRKFDENFEVWSLGRRVVKDPEYVDSHEGIALLVARMEDRSRLLPIIVVADPTHVAPPIPELPRRLARFLFGLAEVVQVERQATFNLTDRIGKEMSCFDGGLRIYWPGWVSSDPPVRHPLFLRHRLSASAAYNPEHPDKLIRSTLMATLVRAAVSRFSYPPEMVGVIADDHARLLSTTLENASSAELIERINELTKEVEYERGLRELALADNSGLQASLEDATAQLEAVTAELDRLRGQTQKSSIEVDYAEGELDDPWAIEGVEVALERARTEFSDTLVIPQNVFTSSNSNGGWWYHVLLALHELCITERRGQAKNKRKVLQDLLGRHLMLAKDTYKIGDTGVNVVNPETGESIELRERVHLREGKPAETESVYWNTIGDEQSSYKYLIGRIGRHA